MPLVSSLRCRTWGLRDLLSYGMHSLVLVCNLTVWRPRGKGLAPDAPFRPPSGSRSSLQDLGELQPSSTLSRFTLLPPCL